MGNESSSFLGENDRRQSYVSRSSWQYDHDQSSYSQYPQNYPGQHPYSSGYTSYVDPGSSPRYYSSNSVDSYTLPKNVGTPTRQQKRLQRRYSRIGDDYHSLEEVTEALRDAGLESSNLIIGIDFTKSNEWTGRRSYNNKSLHQIGSGLNPYEQAISIIGKTLAAFDDDNLIPCYGFGDASTHDKDVFSFNPNDHYCVGFEEVLRRYREIVPQLKLAGPTSFAPIIEMAMSIVEQSGGQYHVLLIIADGQVTGSQTKAQLSCQERKTIEAIVEASKYPLSIVLVGVGDGPWDMMKQFDDNIPARDFDNFQFVNFMEIISKKIPQSRKETGFALAALMEIPSQYKATMELKLLGERRRIGPHRVPLPPPVPASWSFNSRSSLPTYGNRSFQHSFTDSQQPVHSSTYERQICPICLSNKKDMVFGCGHQTCCECGKDLQLCPICRIRIQNKIRLY